MPSRRDLLGALGSTAGAVLGGCAGVTPDGTNSTDVVGTTGRTETTTATPTTDTATGTASTSPPRATRAPLSAAAAAAGGRVVGQPSESSPARIELWFENAGDRPLYAFSGATPPLTDPWSVAPEGMTLLPDDREHVSARDGELSIERESGCWRLGNGLVATDIGYEHELAPGDRLAERYSVFAGDAADGCLPPATYRFDSVLSASLPEPTTDGGSDPGESLSLEFAVEADTEGSIASVSGNVVTADGSV
jgi:hypothetical protein